ncbi:MAG: DUF3987 domain-containing protein [Bacteroidota bacterium]
MIGVPALTALAAGVGNSFRVAIRPNWYESATIWAVTVAPSGSGKTPSMDAALGPIFGLEREGFASHEAARTAYEAELADYQALSPKDQRRAVKPIPPTPTRYRVGDTTIESLGVIHGENARGLLLARDELAGWFGGFDRYTSGSGDLQCWIEMYGGKPITIDRKSSRVPTLYIERPNVSVCGTIQPGVLRDQLKAAHFQSGFVARLLLVEPPTQLQQWTDTSVTREVVQGYERLLRSLYAFPYGDEESPALPLHEYALPSYIAFYDENRRLAHALPDSPLRSALMKLEATAARLALTFSVAESVCRGEHPNEVSPTATVKACRLATWLRYETARLYQKYGFERVSMSRDQRLTLMLPQSFSAADVKEVWHVGRSGAYKVIERLIGAGLAEDATHGTYQRRVDPTASTLDYQAFVPSWVKPEPA